MKNINILCDVNSLSTKDESVIGVFGPFHLEMTSNTPKGALPEYLYNYVEASLQIWVNASANLNPLSSFAFSYFLYQKV